MAFITESTARKNEPTPAFMFYRGSYNKWVNAIIDYFEERQFPREDAYFVSYHNNSIYGYEELVSWYDKVPDPNSKQRLEFAEKIMEFLETNYDTSNIFVELHLSKLKYDKLSQLLTQKGIEYRIYADAVALGEKPGVYEKLIMEETQYRKLRDIKHEKYNMIKLIPNKSPEEAKKLFDQYKGKAHLFGVEKLFDDLKLALKDHWQAKKATEQAKNEALSFVHSENNVELEQFFNTRDVLSSLFEDVHLFDRLNQACGKAMAKIERYLIKAEYLLQKEGRLQASLLKLQIALMKA